MKTKKEIKEYLEANQSVWKLWWYGFRRKYKEHRCRNRIIGMGFRGIEMKTLSDIVSLSVIDLAHRFPRKKDMKLSWNCHMYRHNRCKGRTCECKCHD